MPSVGINPAVGRRTDLVKHAGTLYLSASGNCSLIQGGDRRQRLESGPRSRSVVQHLIVKRRRRGIGQLPVVVVVDSVGQLIAVISRIADHGFHFSRVGICDHNGAGTWIQSELGRCDLSF